MNIKQLLDSESVSKLRPYQRILILGAPGSGKSYLSHRLGELLHLPIIHLDHYFWDDPKNTSPWTPVPEEAFRKKCIEFVDQSSFIMDGNYGMTFDIRWPAADLVIFVDTHPWLCVARQMARVIKDKLGFAPAKDRALGQRERFNIQLFWFTIKFRESHGHLIECRMRELYPETPFIKLN